MTTTGSPTILTRSESTGVPLISTTVLEGGRSQLFGPFIGWDYRAHKSSTYTKMLPANENSPDLSVIIVSTNEGHWLEACISSLVEHAGEATLDVVVVDNDCQDGTSDLVQSRFPQARVVRAHNRGFAHGNNRGLETTRSRFVLFLNPDTEIVSGTFGEVIALLDARRDVGLVGVRQLTPEGDLYPTIRRFPNAVRALADALGGERWPVRPAWAGERVLSRPSYESEVDCDWTSGSFMLARREALQSAGFLDERFFIYSEEPDLCLRIKRAGWGVRHLPQMTIVHHAGKGGVRPRMIAQDVYTRRQYAEKHFAGPHRVAYLSALGVRYAIRLAASKTDADDSTARRAASRLALRTLIGRAEPPFGSPPPTAVIATEPLDCR